MVTYSCWSAALRSSTPFHDRRLTDSAWESLHIPRTCIFDAKMSDYSAQDVARCDLCKTAIAQSYCDFCHVNHKPCIGEHISADYGKHIIVAIHQRKSTLIYPKCETHQTKTCEYQCKDCSSFLCSRCLVSKQHNQEHEFLELEEVFSSKKEQIQNDTKELENQILPVYEDTAYVLEMQIASLDGEYKKLTTEMSKQREKIHREVDNAINQMENKIGEIKMKHHSILQKHLDEIKLLQSLMQQTLLALNEMEESNAVSPTIHYSSKIEEFTKLPPKVNISMPKFIPKQIEREELCSLIGKLTPLSTTLEERVFTAKKPNTSDRELLDEPEVLKTIKTGYEQLNEEQIWISGETAEIKCFNIQGVLQKTIRTKSWERLRDTAVDRNGALLYSSGKTRTLYKVNNDQKEKIITLQGWKPSQLCGTSSGDLLVTMYNNDRTQSKVVRYAGSTVTQTIQFDEEGQPLYSDNNIIKYISENRNLDICMADCEADGQFLCYIGNCDLKDPYGLCVDSNYSLFVCEYNTGNGKKIRYLK
uniref:Uncharacterized protein LOC111108813 n=1 Tax=Crassostrea virginica TaxID=6565 RepID=A0A8B8BBP4_CRAVI|nr:uncharacterized protein LOC111108813 [Crassostrea virginica]